MSNSGLQQRDQKLLNYLQTLELTQEKLLKIKTFLEQEYETINQESHTNFDHSLQITEDELNQLKTLLNYQLPSEIHTAKKQLEILEK